MGEEGPGEGLGHGERREEVGGEADGGEGVGGGGADGGDAGARFPPRDGEVWGQSCLRGCLRFCLRCCLRL